MKRLLSALCLSLGLVSAAQAQDNESAVNDEVFFLFEKAPSGETCHAGNAKFVTLGDVLNDPENYRNQCVSLNGYSGRRALFLNAKDARKKKGEWAETYASRRIGLSILPSNVAAQTTLRQNAFVKVTGMLWFCQDETWAGGYCHHARGPYIGVAQVEPLSPKP